MSKRKRYDYLIVGAGLYSAMFAYSLRKQGKTFIVVEKSPHIGGMCHTENVHGIEVHKFGAHIFRTDSRKVWDFVNSITEFVPFVNTPIANYRGEVYNMPFNMNTFSKIFGVSTPKEAVDAIRKSIVPNDNPKNLEEFALSVVGKEVYEILIKNYTEKQWGCSCDKLPVSTMSRIPIRFTYDNNYYREKYQGVPKYGYDTFIRNLFGECEIVYNCDYTIDDIRFSDVAENVLYTGPIDSYFYYKFGRLDWRSVVFSERYYDNEDNVQGVAVVNYTDDRPFTRSIEHKHFLKTECKGSVVSYEYPSATGVYDTPSYPILNKKNIDLYNRYKEYAKEKCPNVTFAGRLGSYRYLAMNDIIEEFVK